MMHFDANVWSSSRTFEEAETFYKEAISHAAQSRGENDLQTIKAMLNLALLYAGSGKGREVDAIDYFERSIKGACSLRGPASLTTAEIREQYATFLASFDPKAGLDQVRQVLSVKKGIKTLEAETAATLDMAAGLAAVQGFFDESLRFSGEALELKRVHSTEVDCALR